MTYGRYWSEKGRRSTPFSFVYFVDLPPPPFIVYVFTSYLFRILFVRSSCYWYCVEKFYVMEHTDEGERVKARYSFKISHSDTTQSFQTLFLRFLATHSINVRQYLLSVSGSFHLHFYYLCRTWSDCLSHSVLFRHINAHTHESIVVRKYPSKRNKTKTKCKEKHRIEIQ